MTSYSALDSHSRNCSACRRQRQEITRKSSLQRVATAVDASAKKKTSLPELPPCSEHPPSCQQNVRVGLRRSKSTLSTCSEDLLSGQDGDDSSAVVATAAYLTPTQRRAQEMRRVKLQLSRAMEQLEFKDHELELFRRELVGKLEFLDSRRLDL